MFNTKDFYITSDLHLGGKSRGYDSADDHDQAIIDGIMGIPDNSTLIVLGDIAACDDSSALNTLASIKRDKGLTLVLTPGDRDAAHPMHGYSSKDWVPRYKDVFDYVQTSYTINVDGVRLVLGHFPQWGSHAMNFNYEDITTKRWWGIKGGVNVHGHTRSSDVLVRGHVNVSPDAHDMRPIHVSDLVSYAKDSKKFFSLPKN